MVKSTRFGASGEPTCPNPECPAYPEEAKARAARTSNWRKAGPARTSAASTRSKEPAARKAPSAAKAKAVRPAAKKTAAKTATKTRSKATALKESPGKGPSADD
jgi:hypothetical protein